MHCWWCVPYIMNIQNSCFVYTICTYNTICTLLFPFRFLCFAKANDSQRERDWVTVWHYSSSWRLRSDTRLQTTCIHYACAYVRTIMMRTCTHTPTHTRRHRGIEYVDACSRAVWAFIKTAPLYTPLAHTAGKQQKRLRPRPLWTYLASRCAPSLSLSLSFNIISKWIIGREYKTASCLCLSFHCQFNVRCYIVNTKLDQSEQQFKIENHWDWRCFGVKIEETYDTEKS